MTDPHTAAIAEKLRRLLDNSYAPHSGVRVAAAVEGANGALHFGVNVENAAYPEGVCAEASAISAAITAGESRIGRVWVASSLPELVWPCGGCRQKILEFATGGCEVVSLGVDGAQARQAIEALLPLGFRLRGRGAD